MAEAAKAARGRRMPMRGSAMEPKQAKPLVGPPRQESAEAKVEQIVPPPGSKPELGDLNKVGQPNFDPGDVLVELDEVLVELDKAERLLDNIDVRGCELGFRQPQLTTGIETCQCVRSSVDKIEPEFKVVLDNERAWRAADPSGRSSTR